jgi:hypothetical protein
MERTDIECLSDASYYAESLVEEMGDFWRFPVKMIDGGRFFRPSIAWIWLGYDIRIWISNHISHIHDAPPLDMAITDEKVGYKHEEKGYVRSFIHH